MLHCLWYSAFYKIGAAQVLLVPAKAFVCTELEEEAQAQTSAHILPHQGRLGKGCPWSDIPDTEECHLRNWVAAGVMHQFTQGSMQRVYGKET